jgi:hypothetical protein
MRGARNARHAVWSVVQSEDGAAGWWAELRDDGRRTAFCALILKRKPKHGFAGAMTTLTMRVVPGDFIVTGPDIEPMKFKSRPEARDWCRTHHLGSPITEIGPGRKRAPKKRERPSR